MPWPTLNIFSTRERTTLRLILILKISRSMASSILSAPPHRSMRRLIHLRRRPFSVGQLQAQMLPCSCVTTVSLGRLNKSKTTRRYRTKTGRSSAIHAAPAVPTIAPHTKFPATGKRMQTMTTLFCSQVVEGNKGPSKLRSITKP